MHLVEMTSVWLKQVTTNIVRKGDKRFFEADILQNHKGKIYAVCIILWIGIIYGGYFLFHNQVADIGIRRIIAGLKQDCAVSSGYCRKGITSVQQIASESGGHIALDEKSVVRSILREHADMKNLIFASVTDHHNTLFAKVGMEISYNFHRKADNIDKTDIFIEIMPDDQIFVSFISDIIFDSDSKIGEVRLVLRTSLENPINNYLFLFILSLITIPFLLLSAALLYVNIIIKERKKQQEQEQWLTVVIAFLLFFKKENAEKKDEMLGTYRLEGGIGKGGMAELFVATKLGRDGFEKVVALKKILSDLKADPQIITRFKNEAKRAAILQHPNIVATNNFDQIDDDYVIEMEYVSGKNLAEIMAKYNKAMPVPIAVFIMSEICKGLYYAHMKKDSSGKSLNFIHRDISPQNIMISFEGEVKICDFGIAKGGSELTMTQKNEVIGKLAYMPPEQILAQPLDHRIDIYAMGIIFHEILSGKRLYRIKNLAEAAQILHSTPPTLSDVPDDLNRVVMKCLEKDREARYATALETLEDMEKFKHKSSETCNMSGLSKFMRKHFSTKKAVSDTYGYSVVCQGLYQFLTGQQNPPSSS